MMIAAAHLRPGDRIAGVLNAVDRVEGRSGARDTRTFVAFSTGRAGAAAGAPCDPRCFADPYGNPVEPCWYRTWSNDFLVEVTNR